MITDLTNTEWLIKETPAAISEAISYSNLTFTSCNIEYNSISLNPSSGITYGNTNVATVTNNKYSFPIKGYRLIHFTNAVEGGNNDLISWLTQNAKRVRSYNLLNAHLDEDKEDAYKIAVSTYNDTHETEKTKINYIPQEWPYLIFRSENSFTLSINNSTKRWNGTLEYSTDKETWNVWNGATTITAQERTNNKYYIYLRGINNTHLMTSSASNNYWVLNGTNIECLGNIGMLLDYRKAQFFAPSMDNYCFYYLFKGCTGLISAPNLPATVLTQHCYQSMFEGCTGLTTAPSLPALNMLDYCYHSMFKGCTSLLLPPALPGDVQNHCYQSMFEGCTSLTTLPILPSKVLAMYCYRSMFQGCTMIKLSKKQEGEYIYSFRMPPKGIGIWAPLSLGNMFANTGGTFKGDGDMNITYYTNNEPIG